MDCGGNLRDVSVCRRRRSFCTCEQFVSVIVNCNFWWRVARVGLHELIDRSIVTNSVCKNEETPWFLVTAWLILFMFHT